jgi:hypothetical protein
LAWARLGALRQSAASFLIRVVESRGSSSPVLTVEARDVAREPTFARAPEGALRRTSACGHLQKLLLRAIPWVLICALGACKEKPAASASAGQPEYSLARPLAGLPAPRARDAEFRRGLSLELFVGEVQGDARRGAYTAWLDQAMRLGASDLELVVQWSQLDSAAVEMAPNETHTVDDEFLGWLMDQAAWRNLRVLLTPILELDGEPTRAIMPADHKRWFWSYHRFALHYARIAEAHGAGCFTVGWDLPDLDADEAPWRELIADVRKAFQGKVAYGVRPERLPALAFWDALDVVTLVGVGALAQGPAPHAQSQLAALGASLRGWHKTHARPLLLTRTSAAPPTAGAQEQALHDQLDTARALYGGLQGEPLVAGVYLQLAVPGAAGQPALLARAAGEVARHWYAGSRVAAAAARGGSGSALKP